MDENLHKLNSDIERLTSENIALNGRVIKLEQALDDAEQYSRRNCFRISRFLEQANESTDEVVIKIERLFVHRAGLKQSELKGVFLNEDLTKLRSKLFYDARMLVKSQPPCLQDVWSTDQAWVFLH